MNLGFYVVPRDAYGGVCLDIGCNLGDFTAKYKSFFSTIFYLEPQKELFDNLEERFKNDLNVQGIRAAAWSKDEQILTLIEHHTKDHGSVAVKSDNLNDEWLEEKVCECLSISLESLMRDFELTKVDYLKCDCETSEYEFLNKQDLSKIRYIGIELHHQLGPDKYRELINWIQKTHKLVTGHYTYTPGMNREVLFELI